MTQQSHYTFCPYDGEKLAADPDPTASHPSCRVCGFVDYHNPVACVVIFISKGIEILLARRREEPAKGAWDIPGGFVEAGESAEKAVQREALEETTLDVRVKEYLGSIPDIYGVRGTPTLNLCFLVDVIKGDPKPKSDVESLGWFSLREEMPTFAFAHQKLAIDILKNRLGMLGT